MPALRPPYLALAAVALVVVVVGAVLLASGGQAPGGVGAIGPTPSALALPDATASPTGLGGTTQPTTSSAPPTPSTPSATPTSNAKDRTPVSAAPEDLEGYVWPLRNALITGRMGPREFGAFVIID